MNKIKKHLELPHRETIISVNTLQTKPFDNQKTQNMIDKQQTAVEWLTVEAMKLFTQAMTGTLNEDTLEDDVSTIITKAKEMEKEQIIDDFNEGFTEGCRYTTGFEQTLWQDEDDYYNKTYKQQ